MHFGFYAQASLPLDLEKAQVLNLKKKSREVYSYAR